MIKSKDLFNLFQKNNINFFSGVPDSVLKNFLYYLEKQKRIKHIIAVNEGSAVSTSIGYYLDTKKIGLVYMQNSGLGNAVNPLISIADKNVYSTPLVLLIGWRGAPKTKDEPQHIAKGKITKNILQNLRIKNILIDSKKDFKEASNLIKYAKNKKVPIALLIKNNTFLKEKPKISKNSNYSILRSAFILELIKNLTKNERIVSTTGYTSRELYQLRKLHNLYKSKDFYMVGGMGHSASVALGCSLKKKSNIICLDGDGSMLMHMGSLVTVNKYAKQNYKYILLNNNSHESVGGQNTNISTLDLKNYSKSVGFKNYYQVNAKSNCKKIIQKYLNSKGPSFLEVKTKKQSMSELKRPKNFNNIKINFMS